MGKATGFLEIARDLPERRLVAERLRDFSELEGKHTLPVLQQQGARCMDCGIPFCHKGCPLGNAIPDWNDLVYRGRMHDAIAMLHATNNFPEITGRVCPAPCEDACVLNLQNEPVTIKQIEKQIIDQAFAEDWVVPQRSDKHTGKQVAVIGSGPAGLSCAQQLVRAGHSVTVFERDDRIGGLLRYGIPDFKLEKHTLDKRLEQLKSEGVAFRTGVNVGHGIAVETLRTDFDAVCLAIGATAARELPIEGRALPGVHLAMDYLIQQNKASQWSKEATPPPLYNARGKHVTILGGGDTGSDCLGTALRQGAASVKQWELMARPSDARDNDNPWPEWSRVYRTSSSQEEGGERDFAVMTKRFLGDEQGKLTAIEAVRVEKSASGTLVEVQGSAFRVPVDMVLLAMGFTGPEQSGPVEELNLSLTDRHAISTNERFATNLPGVFACGDARRGQSLVVWAIWEGREVARQIDIHLMGKSDLLSSPG